jgi:hypothetical protein
MPVDEMVIDELDEMLENLRKGAMKRNESEGVLIQYMYV